MNKKIIRNSMHGKKIGIRSRKAKSIWLDGIFNWISRWPRVTLLVLTFFCLLPFSGKAIHIDDPIFIWTAKQVIKHPLNPYGFSALWWWHTTPMWQIQQNPPLASYYAALIGSLAGWSERALHLGFILPALGVILGTYHLARRLTEKALLAAAATLLTPGFLVSATGLMCDVMMLALWMMAIIFWVQGLEAPLKPIYLTLSGFLIAACALTKYFGMSLIPLLLVYSLVRQRSLRSWIGYLIIPVFVLAGYEFYTHEIYGYGLISQAILHSSYVRELEGRSGRALVGLAYTGGCALTALTFVALLWSRKQILWGSILSAFLAFSFFENWIDLGTIYAYEKWFHEHLLLVSIQLLFYVAGGISVLALAITDFWKKKDAASLLLLLWVIGTIFFAIVVNWSVNARVIMPIIPAVAILIGRRSDEARGASVQWGRLRLIVPLVASAAVSLWAAAGDAALANTARTMAANVKQKSHNESGTVRFEGRWGFQYYMESFGARPLEEGTNNVNSGDLIVVPEYNTSIFKIPWKMAGGQFVDIEVDSWITTMNPDAGAGFYFSGWGPLPFAIGPVPNQRYYVGRVGQAQ